MRISNTYSDVAEKTVLSASLTDFKHADKVCGELQLEDFHFPENREYYRCIRNLYNTEKNITLSNVLDEMANIGARHLSEDYLLDCLAHFSDETITDKIETIKSKTYNRKLYVTTQTIQKSIASNEIVDKDCFEKYLEKLLDLKIDQKRRTGIVYNDYIFKNEYGRNIVKEAEYLAELRSQGIDPRTVNSVMTGYPLFDEYMGGLTNKNFIVVGGRPAMGKTTFCLNIVKKMIYEQRDSAMFVSLEMPHDELANKMAFMEAKVSYNQIKKGNQTPQDAYALQGVLNKERGDNVGKLVIECPNKDATVAHIRYLAKRHIETSNIKALFIDNLNLLKSSQGSHDNYTKITEITRDLRLLAEELDIPIILIAHLNRANTNRDNKAPQLQDLRDSGSIEQDAVQVIFIHRPGYYEPPGGDLRGTKVKIAKNRHGPTGVIDFDFDLDIQVITELEPLNEYIQNEKTRRNI